MKSKKGQKGSSGYLILIVDDNDEIRIVFKELLEREGYRVIEATNGREGVDAAVGERPHLILMNYLMPVMDGLKATAEIRTQPGLENVPILLNSIYSRQEMCNKAQLAGCDDFFEIPTDFRAMIEKVRTYISSGNSIENLPSVEMH